MYGGEAAGRDPGSTARAERSPAAGAAPPWRRGGRVRRLAVAFFALVPAAAPSEAPRTNGPPPLPTDPVLAGLIEESLAARPELAQARAVARAERERAPQVGALPDPMLQLGVQNDSFTAWNIGKMETSWYSIMGSQTFPWPGKLRLRSEIAELGARQADQSAARIGLSTEADVRRAYLGLMLARDRLALLDRLEALSLGAAAVVQVRYEVGTAAQSEVLRAQLELKRIRQRRWVLQAEVDSAAQALNRLRGHPLDEVIRPPAGVADLAVPALSPEPVALQDAFDRSPELASARAGLAQGQRALALARKGPLPDVTVNLGVMPRGGEFPPMWLATLGVPIPAFAASKQSRAVAESEARLAASRSDVQALEQILRLRVQQRRTALGAILEILRLYREGLLAQSEATASSTLSQYEVGKVTYLSVLEANAGFISDQESYLQALAQAQRLQIDAAEVSLEPVGMEEPTGARTGVRGGGMQAGATPPQAGMPAPSSAAATSTGAGLAPASGMGGP